VRMGSPSLRFVISAHDHRRKYRTASANPAFLQDDDRRPIYRSLGLDIREFK